MNRNQLRNTAVATGAASLLFLSTAAPALADAAGPLPPSPLEVEQAQAAQACGGLTAEDAVAKWGDELPSSPLNDQGLPMKPILDPLNIEDYDPCHGLSAIPITYTTGAGGEIPKSMTMLFYDGQFVDTDSTIVHEYEPDIERVDDNTLVFEYGYGRATDHAGPAGTVTSTFTWNKSLDEVVHTGQFPPTN